MEGKHLVELRGTVAAGALVGRTSDPFVRLSGRDLDEGRGPAMMEEETKRSGRRVGGRCVCVLRRGCECLGELIGLDAHGRPRDRELAVPLE